MKYPQLRTKILLIVISTTILLLTIINLYNYYDRKKILYSISIEKLLLLTKVIRNFEKEQFIHYKGRSEAIAKNKHLLNAIQNKENKTIENIVNPLYHPKMSRQLFQKSKRV